MTEAHVHVNKVILIELELCCICIQCYYLHFLVISECIPLVGQVVEVYLLFTNADLLLCIEYWLHSSSALCFSLF